MSSFFSMLCYQPKVNTYIFFIRTHYSTEKSVYLLFSILIRIIIIFEYFFPYYNNSKQIKIPVFGTKLNCLVTNQKNLSTIYFCLNTKSKCTFLSELCLRVVLFSFCRWTLNLEKNLAGLILTRTLNE